jgi:hypothetical protein
VSGPIPECSTLPAQTTFTTLPRHATSTTTRRQRNGSRNPTAEGFEEFGRRGPEGGPKGLPGQVSVGLLEPGDQDPALGQLVVEGFHPFIGQRRPPVLRNRGDPFNSSLGET